MPFTALAGGVSSGTLLNLRLVVSNLCDDAHDCPWYGGSWFKARVADMLAGRTGRAVGWPSC